MAKYRTSLVEDMRALVSEFHSNLSLLIKKKAALYTAQQLKVLELSGAKTDLVTSRQQKAAPQCKTPQIAVLDSPSHTTQSTLFTRSRLPPEAVASAWLDPREEAVIQDLEGGDMWELEDDGAGEGNEGYESSTHSFSVPSQLRSPPRSATQVKLAGAQDRSSCGSPES